MCDSLTWMTVLVLLLLPYIQAKSPCSEISITGRSGVTTFKQTAVSLNTWQDVRQEPSQARNPVVCAQRCLQEREIEPDSCNSITFSDSTKECRLGFIIADSSQPSETVLMIQQPMSPSTTASTTSTAGTPTTVPTPTTAPTDVESGVEEKKTCPGKRENGGKLSLPKPNIKAGRCYFSSCYITVFTSHFV